MTDSHAETTVTQPAPTEQPERLDLLSHEIVSDKQAELVRLFPEVRTEGGRIDFDRLKRVLGEAVDPGRERYGLNWAGKADCFKAIQNPSLGTLLPCREASVNFDTSGNVIIEGDNLEVLKLMQKAYLSKIKMIYIDPPYNTGNDFIYPDNYSESLQTYLEYTGQVDSGGRKFSSNTEADGRYHSKWINMMYPRLYLARNLLRDDGVIFMTIDDTEVANLRALTNEIFGEENFVANIVWEKKYAKQNDATWFSTSHDHVLLYAKQKDVWKPNQLQRTEEQLKGYSNPDGDERGSWQSVVYTCNKTREERPNLYYPITHPSTGKDVWPKETRVWGYEPAKHKQHIAENRLWWGTKGELEKPRLKVFLNEVGSGLVPDTLWLRSEVGDNQDAKRILLELLPESGFETPKPPSLIIRMLALATKPANGDIVLDFFAGSGTTGQAVLEQNTADQGNRRFILVQLPEETGQAKYPTICDLTEERIRRVIQNLNSQDDQKLPLGDASQADRGFRVFKLAESNFRPWIAQGKNDPIQLAQQLEMHVDHIRDGKSAEGILTELLLKSGFPLATQVQKLSLCGQDVYSVADGAMLVCLERSLTPEVIKSMADMKPQRVICLDEGFAANDQLKTNAVQMMKSKGVTSFRTV